ncbi:hypothetical protein MIR68_011380 [Amoeboaphelidium protococcarum]|nr:hypothetical protein MIR68_011380 [Amoeboaphelidium protococcarum]
MPKHKRKSWRHSQASQQGALTQNDDGIVKFQTQYNQLLQSLNDTGKKLLVCENKLFNLESNYLKKHINKRLIIKSPNNNNNNNNKYDDDGDVTLQGCALLGFTQIAPDSSRSSSPTTKAIDSGRIISQSSHSSVLAVEKSHLVDIVSSSVASSRDPSRSQTPNVTTFPTKR